MKNLTVSQVDNLISQYLNKNGELLQIEEGSLGHGFLILQGEGLKTTIVKEVFISAWASGHEVTMYNKLPKKYQQIIENDFLTA
jgi:hypothetical protein